MKGGLAMAAMEGERGPGGAELLKLAAAQRMSTDARRAAFCVVMGSEDFIDASDRLLRLPLKVCLPILSRFNITRLYLHPCFQANQESERRQSRVFHFLDWLGTLIEHPGRSILLPCSWCRHVQDQHIFFFIASAWAYWP